MWVGHPNPHQKPDFFSGSNLCTWHTKACTNLLAKYYYVKSASANLSSQVTVSACRQTNPPNDLSFMKVSNNLFDQVHQERHISISSHILQSGEKSLEAGKIRKMAVNKSEWCQLFVVSKKKKPPKRSSKL